MATRRYGRGTRTEAERQAEAKQAAAPSHLTPADQGILAGRADARRDAAAAAKPKTYAVRRGSRTVRVTIPERHDGAAYEGSLAEILRDVLKDSVSPPAIASLANAVRVQVRSGLKNPAVVRELTYLSTILLDMLGGQYQALLDEAGVPGERG